MQKCSEVMTGDVACCLRGDTVDQAAQLMKAEDVGPVPVVEDQETKKLVGIVTDRDLAIKIVAEGRDPKSTRVEEVMTRDLVTCRPDDDLQKALDAMARHQVRRVPIVDNNGSIVGILAQADVVTRTEQPEKTEDMIEDISQPG
jgi:CBS domain-containing protein